MGKRTEANGAGPEITDAMRHAASKLGDDLSRTAHDAREAAEEISDALRHSAREMATNAKSRANAAHRGLRRGVREHPIAWLGAAAGAGALASLLLVASRSRPN
ncbi:MAG: hypothetical protein R3C30_05275 [Hyphomonadaceae bacterium]